LLTDAGEPSRGDGGGWSGKGAEHHGARSVSGRLIRPEGHCMSDFDQTRRPSSGPRVTQSVEPAVTRRGVVTIDREFLGSSERGA
jgi:hypothetical protein